MKTKENNGDGQQKKQPGRPKTVKTGTEIREELGIEIKVCSSCGATPATEVHFAGKRILCRKCARPYFIRYLKKIGGACIIAFVFVLYAFT